ncbi:MAG: DNA methyltransferase [Candidatus Poribacteria bacterium]|nr:DNA methyltransferase [Candidatus Poribacteria bacterium]
MRKQTAFGILHKSAWTDALNSILESQERRAVAQDFMPNCLYYGDCLDWMREWEADCVDLIYLDPPFNSNANYNVLFGAKGDGKAQYRAFNDTWHWDDAAAERYAKFENAPARPAHDAMVGLRRIIGRCGMLAYLTYMAERLEEMSRLLKPTGSIYLHCDPYASHYLKIVMDAVFGERHFQNELVWYYSGGGASKKRFARKHDTIFFYTKSNRWTFNVDEVRVPYKWTKGQRRADGSERDYEKGKLPDDVIALNSIMPWASEHTGYPTQKPLKLLERIVKASSNEGDLVLDPFCGCGTAVDAARRLKRRWAGIDISSFAIDLVRKRLKDESIPIKGIPADLESARKLAREKPFEFESWAVTRLPGFAPNTKQVADGGVDGRGMLFDQPDDWDSRLALAQVKGGKFSASALRDFIGVVNNDKAAIGRFITLEPVGSADARSRAAEQGTIAVRGQSYRRLSLWSIDDYFNNRPCPLPPMTNPYTGKLMQQGLF